MMNLNKTYQRQGGFTLMETVISIGLLAVLLSAFMVAFMPAVEGIQKSLSVEESNRLAFALERELVTLRKDEVSDYDSGFDKAFQWIDESIKGSGDKAIFVYQYRAGLDQEPRVDGSLPVYTEAGGVAGQNFVVQPMVRTLDSPLLEEDLEAIEGPLIVAKLTQLVLENGTLEKSQQQEIVYLDENGSAVPSSDSASYLDAVIAFSVDFHVLRNSSYNYITGNGFDPVNLTKPVFTRNLAVRR